MSSCVRYSPQMILVVDNYDSFTYNLVQLLWMTGSEVEVVRNDEIEPSDLAAKRPRGIVLSPGPGRPENAGACPDLVRARPQTPMLGVCLGHQVLGFVHGATVDRAPELLHGKTSLVRHDCEGIFEGLPSPFEATRYHSLRVQADSLPPELQPVAWSEDDVLMGMRHRELPYWGVQFHPESILTGSGPDLVRNFVAICGEGSSD